MKTVLIACLILASLGLILGIGLVIASKVFYVKIDEREEKIKEMLPNANCGGCGHAGCSGFAKAIIDGEETKLSKCRVAKKEMLEQILAYLKDHPSEDKIEERIEI